MRSLALLYPELVVGTYYRRLRSGPGVPTSGGLVIYTNHTNGLIDGGMTLFLTDRKQSFLAKASLFRIPLLSWMIRWVGAIPIYRQKDQVDMSRNEDSFREVHEVLRQGHVLVIYPEGESRLGWRLRPFKTGAARMVLGAEQEALAPGSIRMLPVLLLYEEQETFLSRAHLWTGEPFDAGEFLDLYALDEREAVRGLTAEMQRRLESMTIPVGDSTTFQGLVELDRMLAGGPEQAPARLHALGLQLQALTREQPALAHELVERARTLGTGLARLGLEGYDLVEGGLRRGLSLRAQALATLLLALPLAVVWGPPVALARSVAWIGRSTADKLVTVSVIGSSVLVPLWWAGLAVWGRVPGHLGIRCGLVGCLGLLGLNAIRNAGRPRPIRRAWTLLGLQGHRKAVDSLWNQKRSLCQAWQEAVWNPAVRIPFEAPRPATAPPFQP
ncbi:MAG: 1-acyl-sn-glycerol-3-phosphate acyltransferase [Planctomycetes bacterium]|nr:1-acyl-sn-glycerol-3-phosphate acyltransferase [Planctomycetota bacterium]MCB9910307.1 1-acyl-sn-glycerol-3-phosphate acyltransferase [Planctomycetota bacterium]HPF13093.1 1-acyl-sn-glycerol-3-phosphate acyltransferase [Planctomycetota bacterium]